MIKKIVALLFISASAHAVCQNYTYQRALTISSTSISGNVVNFPILVTSNNIIYSTTALSGQLSTGFDLTYSSDSACAFMLNWDTETVNTTGTQTRNEWVQVPLLSTASATAATIYQNWGNASITSYIGNSTAAWDSNFVGVYHLPNGQILSPNDSTINANNGTVTGATASAGAIDGAGSFSFTNYVSAADAASLNPNAITITAWVNGSLYENSYNTIVHKQSTGFYEYFITSAKKMAIYLAASGGTVDYDGSGSNTLSLSTWYMVSFTYSSSTGLIGYLNASVDNTAAANGTLSISGGPFRYRSGQPSGIARMGWTFRRSSKFQILSATPPGSPPNTIPSIPQAHSLGMGQFKRPH